MITIASLFGLAITLVFLKHGLRVYKPGTIPLRKEFVEPGPITDRVTEQ